MQGCKKMMVLKYPKESRFFDSNRILKKLPKALKKHPNLSSGTDC